jgi:uncharacterized repeat protein (TIGR01451 family)
MPSRCAMRAAALVFLIAAALIWTAPAWAVQTVLSLPSPEPIFPEALEVSAIIEPGRMVEPETAHLTISMTNAGDAPIADVRLLRASGAVVKQIGTLGPGASYAFEEDIALSMDQFQAGGVIYLVRCTLNPGTGREIGGRMTVHVPLERIPAQPSVEFSRSVSSEYVQAGEQVALTYRIVNTGNVTLTDLVVSDPVAGDVGTLRELAPGRKHTFTARVSIWADSSSLPSLTCFSKADPDQPIVRDLGATHIEVTNQRLEAVLTADFAAIKSGEFVTLKLTLHNASDIACEKLRIYDQSGAELDTPPISLKPDERYELTYPLALRETTTLLLTVSGKTEGGSVISTRSNALTVAVRPSEGRAHIQLAAQINPNTPAGPGKVRFTLRLTNTGEEVLRGVSVSEQSRGPIRTLWVVPPGETLIEQEYPISARPYVFLAEMDDVSGGHLTVLSPAITIEAAAQPVAQQPTPTPLPALSGDSYRLADEPTTYLAMMVGAATVLITLILIFAVIAVRRRRKIEKQRRIHIKRIRRSMRKPKDGLSQDTRPMPAVGRDADRPPDADKKRG